MQWALHNRVTAALRGDVELRSLRNARPRDWRDALTTMLELHALHLAPLETLSPAAVWHQHEPALSRLKLDLEAELTARLDSPPSQVDLPRDPAAAMRAIAARDLVPPVYDWLAEEATYPEIVEFLAIEGGPDAGFDDLVAICQIGLGGIAKVTLGANYWDEMGDGNVAHVHTELHHQLVRAVRMRRIPMEELPVQALERSALNGLLATNRALQPEMLGALGLLEIQAGPRCRRVLTALRRVSAPADSLPFYEVHADTDPRHGKEWLDDAVTPLAEEHPEWGPRIVRGARWRSLVNGRLFDALRARFQPAARQLAGRVRGRREVVTQ